MRLLVRLFAVILAIAAGNLGANAAGRFGVSAAPVLTMSAFGRLLPSLPAPARVHDSAGLARDALGRAPAGVELIQTACLALAIYHEARGEPERGQRAVAATIVNRARSKAYPSSFCGVVYDGASRRHKCQFSFACDGRSDVPANARAVAASVRIAAEAIASAFGPSSSCAELATHYHRFDIAPVWSKKLRPLGRLGDHLFLASDRVIRRMKDAAFLSERVGLCRFPAIGPVLRL